MTCLRARLLRTTFHSANAAIQDFHQQESVQSMSNHLACLSRSVQKFGEQAVTFVKTCRGVLQILPILRSQESLKPS